MELFRCRLEVSNAMKQADDNTFDLCFDKMITAFFGDRRSLIKYLLYHKFNKDEMIQVKNIFNNEFKRLIDAKNERSDDEDIDIEKKRVIPTLTNISEHMQTHITSFLDFHSIKKLGAVCSTIAPIALNEFSKIDVETCNVHQLSNDNQHIMADDIIEANSKTFRVRKTTNVREFVENELDIAAGNVLAFNYFSKKEVFIEPTFDGMTGKYNRNNCWIIFGDKTKINSFGRPMHMDIFTKLASLIIIQEFDAKDQTLKIKQIAQTNTSMRVENIKSLINVENDLKEQMSLYLSRQSRINDWSRTFKISPSFGGRLGSDYVAESSIIYQIELSEGEIAAIRNERYRNLEPFFADFEQYYSNEGREQKRLGVKYHDLAIELRTTSVGNAKGIAKCFGKAYDLNPTDPDFIYDYANALMKIKDFKNAQNIIFKAIKIIQDILAKEESKQMKLKLCKMYHNIAVIYKYGGGNHDEMMQSYLFEAREYYENKIKAFAKFAFYRKEFGDFLRACGEYEEALKKYDKAIEIVENDKDGTSAFEYSLYACYDAKFECLIDAKKFKMAEKIGLKMIDISKYKNNKEHKSSYQKMIDLYRNHLKDTKTADSYASIMIHIFGEEKSQTNDLIPQMLT